MHLPLRLLSSPRRLAPSPQPLLSSLPLCGSATNLTPSGFINYLFTTPLVVLSLSLLAGLSPSDTLVALLATLGMVVTALLSALSPARWHSGERARWGWFAFSCVGFVAVWCTLFSEGLKGGSDVSARLVHTSVMRVPSLIAAGFPRRLLSRPRENDTGP
jgi:hypothetical protein